MGRRRLFPSHRQRRRFDLNPPLPCLAKIQLITNPQPQSFAANANQVIRYAAKANADAYFLNNDVIFTAGWLAPVAAEPSAVVTPTSNQNFQYQVEGFELKPVMTLEDTGPPGAIPAACRAASNAAHRLYRSLQDEFLLCENPPWVYRSVGLFDTRFGMAGGEDDDYCIRTYLRGLRVLVAVRSYLLHFGGRSTWSGSETLDQWRAREQNFIGIFQNKWGPTLTRFLLYRDPSILSRDPVLQAAQQRGDIPALFAAMAKRDGISIEEYLFSQTDGLAES